MSKDKQEYAEFNDEQLGSEINDLLLYLADKDFPPHKGYAILMLTAHKIATRLNIKNEKIWVEDAPE